MNIFKLLLVGAVSATLLASTTHADTQQRKNNLTIDQIYYNYAWTKDQWIGNDVPYQKARVGIEALVASGVNPESLVKKFAAQAQEHPDDALSQFRWGYATHEAMESPAMTNSEWQDRREELLRALVFAKPPYTYNYDRLHFLALCDAFPRPQIVGVGLRLLHKDPQDVQIKYAVASLLDDSDSAADRQKAIVLTNELIKQYPNVPKYYGLMAGIDYTTWFKTKSHVDAENAIAAYQHYLDIAPPDASFRADAQLSINFIRQQPGN